MKGDKTMRLRMIVYCLVTLVVLGVGLFGHTSAVDASYSGSGCDYGDVIVHTVRQGETLAGIARRYGSTVAAIASANNLYNPNIIYIGQRLYVPCSVSNYYAAPMNYYNSYYPNYYTYPTYNYYYPSSYFNPHFQYQPHQSYYYPYSNYGYYPYNNYYYQQRTPQITYSPQQFLQDFRDRVSQMPVYYPYPIWIYR